MDSLISQLCLLPFPSLHLLPELLFSLHCHSLLLKESYMLYLFIFLSWSPHYNTQMVEKGGNFSVKLLQNLPFISSQILYFALFPRSVQSAFYPDSLLLITMFLQRYMNCWRRENLYVSLLRKEFCFLLPQQIFNDPPTSQQNATLIFLKSRLQSSYVLNRAGMNVTLCLLFFAYDTQTRQPFRLCFSPLKTKTCRWIVLHLSEC